MSMTVARIRIRLTSLCRWMDDVSWLSVGFPREAYWIGTVNKRGMTIKDTGGDSGSETKMCLTLALIAISDITSVGFYVLGAMTLPRTLALRALFQRRGEKIIGRSRGARLP
jgi:hypothetical protein